MINLLPYEAQHQLRADQSRAALTAFGIIVTAMLAIGFVMLLPSFVALRYLTRDLSYAREVEERSPVSRALGERTRALATLESRARSVLAHARTAPSFEDVLREVTRVAPAGIDLLTMRFEEHAFTIEGHYQYRSSFLAFLEALKTNAFVKSVASPLSNLLKETDAPFHVILSL